jgi:hypothetical protein
LILLKQSSTKVKPKGSVKHSNRARVFHHFHDVLPLFSSIYC